MKTTEIERLMRKVPNYMGTFSSDNVPDRSGLMIVNLDPEHLPGTHWIAIYISHDRRRGEYFDSFGRRPNKHFANIMDERCRRWIYNKKQLQSIASKYCGHYCMLYCICRSRGMDMPKFVSGFTRDTGLNDAIVAKSLRRIEWRY
jgi:hypothetical protein